MNTNKENVMSEAINHLMFGRKVLGTKSKTALCCSDCIKSTKTQRKWVFHYVAEVTPESVHNSWCAVRLMDTADGYHDTDMEDTLAMAELGEEGVCSICNV